jgi:membrane protein required for colicin V production
MTIDIIFLILLVIAIFKGMRRGLIVAVFSMLALVAGLAAAMKLSVIFADYLHDSISISAKWLPILSFVLVFLAVVLLVRWVAAMLERLIDIAWLGWINKLGAVILYAALYTAIFSVLLFYGIKSGFISSHSVSSSQTYAFIRPWGPWLMDGLGRFIPWFKDMFTELEAFFNRLSEHLPK